MCNKPLRLERVIARPVLAGLSGGTCHAVAQLVSTRGKAQAPGTLSDIAVVQLNLRELAIDTGLGVMLWAVFCAPVGFALYRVYKSLTAASAKTRDLLGQLPLRPPGETMRLRIEQLVETLHRQLLVRVLLTAFVLALVALAPAELKWWAVAGAFAIVLVDALLSVPRILRTTRALEDARLSFMGERAVAEELNQLLTLGYHVFHDMPFEKYNLDHVVVGRTGVFVIETETHRRPRRSEKGKELNVNFDGETLFWPNGKQTGARDQALFNARALSHWLGSAVGEPVTVQGIVTTPGWSVTTKAEDHRVLAGNPRELRQLFEARQGGELPSALMQRVAQELAQRVRAAGRRNS